MPQKPIDADIRAKIRRLANLGLAGTEIHAALQRDPVKKRKDDLPSLRSVQRLAQELTPEQTSLPWTLADDEGTDTKAVLYALAAVIVETQGRRSYITEDEARWIRKLAKAAPGLGPFGWYVLAREYLRREQQGEATTVLDQFLAFEPWRFSDFPGPHDLYGDNWRGEEMYRGAVKDGWVEDADRILSGLYDRERKKAPKQADGLPVAGQGQPLTDEAQQ